jgi:hypothetical protein
MDHAEGVGFGDGLAGLQHEVDGEGHLHRALLAHERAEIAAVQVLHHQVRRAALQRADVEHAPHVFAADARRGLPFALETLHQLGLHQGARQEELDRDAFAQREVSRGDDDPHAACPEHSLHAVLAREDVSLLKPGPSSRLGGLSPGGRGDNERRGPIAIVARGAIA